MLRECLARGSDNQTSSSSLLHAKYTVLTWACPPRATVASAQSVDAPRRLGAVAAIRPAATGRLDRSIAIAEQPARWSGDGKTWRIDLSGAVAGLVGAVLHVTRRETSSGRWAEMTSCSHSPPSSKQALVGRRTRRCQPSGWRASAPGFRSKGPRTLKNVDPPARALFLNVLPYA